MNYSTKNFCFENMVWTLNILFELILARTKTKFIRARKLVQRLRGKRLCATINTALIYFLLNLDRN